MNDTSEIISNERGFLTIEEGVKFLWEWRKYRNQTFWNSVYRLGAASVTVAITPYLLPDLIGKLGLAVLVFPIMAAVLSVFAAYLMIVQYMLYKLVDRKYRSFLGRYSPGDIPDIPVNRLFRISIGKVLAGVFLCFGVIGQLLNGLVLFSLVRAALP